MATAWHTLSPTILSETLQSHCQDGLSRSEVQQRLATYGPNALPEPIPPSPIVLFLPQFMSVIVWVLFGAAILSALLHEWVDAVAIVAILLLNAVLGFVQESRAERSRAALKKLSVTTARVFRDGALVSIPAHDIVPGDLLLIEAGEFIDEVPFDAERKMMTMIRKSPTGMVAYAKGAPDVLLTKCTQYMAITRTHGRWRSPSWSWRSSPMPSIVAATHTRSSQ